MNMKKLFILFVFSFLLSPSSCFAGGPKDTCILKEPALFATSELCSGLLPFSTNTDYHQIYCAIPGVRNHTYSPSSLCTPVIKFANTDLWQIYCALEAESGGGGSFNTYQPFSQIYLGSVTGDSAVSDGNFTYKDGPGRIPYMFSVSFNDTSGVFLNVVGGIKPGISAGIGSETNSPIWQLLDSSGANLVLPASWQTITKSGLTVIYNWPGVQGSAGTFLTNDGTGNLSWTSPHAGWNLTGNSGTAPATNFIGTTDSTSFECRTNNVMSFMLGVSTGNSFFGRYSGAKATGFFNNGFGNGALQNLTTGTGNTANGFQALQTLAQGSNNTAIGFQAGVHGTGTDDIYIGRDAGAANTTRSNQIYLGDSLVTFSYNVAPGAWQPYYGGIYNPGNPGQVLTSQGAGATPQWTIPTPGSTQSGQNFSPSGVNPTITVSGNPYFVALTPGVITGTLTINIPTAPSNYQIIDITTNSAIASVTINAGSNALVNPITAAALTTTVPIRLMFFSGQWYNQ